MPQVEQLERNHPLLLKSE